MKKKQLLLVPFILVGCNNSNVNKTKSPFNDSYNPIGMKGQYTITKEITPDEYNGLRTSINNYNDNPSYIVSSYTRVEETRDLKAAYFGKNIGAANLCSLTHQSTTNTRYSNNVTTKFTSAHKENQTVSGGIAKSNPVVNEYYFEHPSDDTKYKHTQQTWNDGEGKTTSLVKIGTTATDLPYNLNAYTGDINNNFGTIKKRDAEIVFKVLDTNNNAVYGKTADDKYLIKEAASLYAPYSTTVGDTYKAVNNFFYEAILEQKDGNFRFTNFRFYTELLILSEAISDEKTVPVLYLDKPQLVEYSEIKFNINYSDVGNLPTYQDVEHIPGRDLEV